MHALVEVIEWVVDERVNALLTALNAQQAKKWLTPAEAAERLHCTPDAARRRAKRGRLEARYQGRSVYISAESVDGLR